MSESGGCVASGGMCVNQVSFCIEILPFESDCPSGFICCSGKILFNISLGMEVVCILQLCENKYEQLLP